MLRFKEFLLSEVYKSLSTLQHKLDSHNMNARGYMKHRDSIPGAVHKAKLHFKAAHLAAAAANKKTGAPAPTKPNLKHLDKGHNPFTGKQDRRNWDN